MTVTATPGSRVPRRRIVTRQRLLEATHELLREGGMTAITVDSVTSRAGYTRGAFYSNFSSVEGLLFGLYSQRMAAVVEKITEKTAQLTANDLGDPRSTIEHVMGEIPFDLGWLRIRIEFASQAQHDPALLAEFEAREGAFLDALTPVLEHALAKLGLEPIGSAGDLCRAVVAAHNGALVNSILAPDPATFRATVCTAVITALTRPRRPSP